MSKLHFGDFINLDGSILIKDYRRTFNIESLSEYSLLIDAYTFASDDLVELAENFLTQVKSSNINTNIFIAKLCYESVGVIDSSRTEKIDDFMQKFGLETFKDESLLCSLLNDSESNFLILPIRGTIYAEIIRNAKTRKAKTHILISFDPQGNSYTVFDVSSYVNDWKDGNLEIGLDTNKKYDTPAPQDGENFYILGDNGELIDEFTYNSGWHFGTEASVQHLKCADMISGYFQKDITAKIFTGQRTQSEMGKLSLMLQRSLNHIDGLEAWPLNVVCDEYENVRGFVMETIPGHHINKLNQGKDAFRNLFVGKTKEKLVSLCLNIVKTDIQSAIKSFHLIDNNFQNIILDQSFRFHYIDLDSAQFSFYPSEVISYEAHNNLHTIMQNNMNTELEVPFVSARVSSYITALTIWKLLFFATSPYIKNDNKWIYWGELSITDQVNTNELLAATYSWFPPSLRFAFYLNFCPIYGKAISLTNIYMALKDFLKELQLNNIDARANLIVPETFNPQNESWDQEFRLNVEKLSTSPANSCRRDGFQDVVGESVEKTEGIKQTVLHSNYKKTMETIVTSPQFGQRTFDDKKILKSETSTKDVNKTILTHSSQNEEPASSPKNAEETYNQYHHKKSQEKNARSSQPNQTGSDIENMVKNESAEENIHERESSPLQENQELGQKDMQSFLKSLLIKGFIIAAIILSIIIYLSMEW